MMSLAGEVASSARLTKIRLGTRACSARRRKGAASTADAGSGETQITAISATSSASMDCCMNSRLPGQSRMVHSSPMKGKAPMVTSWGWASGMAPPSIPASARASVDFPTPLAPRMATHLVIDPSHCRGALGSAGDFGSAYTDSATRQERSRVMSVARCCGGAIFYPTHISGRQCQGCEKMQTRSKFFDDISQLMTNAAGVAQGARTEAETAMRGWFERFLAESSMVTREEFDAVREMALKAREENDRLSRRIDELEGRQAGQRAAGEASAASREGGLPGAAGRPVRNGGTPERCAPAAGGFARCRHMPVGKPKATSQPLRGAGFPLYKSRSSATISSGPSLRAHYNGNPWSILWESFCTDLHENGR